MKVTYTRVETVALARASLTRAIENLSDGSLLSLQHEGGRFFIDAAWFTWLSISDPGRRDEQDGSFASFPIPARARSTWVTPDEIRAKLLRGVDGFALEIYFDLVRQAGIDRYRPVAVGEPRIWKIWKQRIAQFKLQVLKKLESFFDLSRERLALRTGN